MECLKLQVIFRKKAIMYRGKKAIMYRDGKIGTGWRRNSRESVCY